MIKARRMRWAGYVARKGEKRNAYMHYWWKSRRKEELGSPKRRWMENIKMVLQMRFCDMNRIGLAQDKDTWRALVNKGMNLRVP
jgi:hypothetical protein